MGGSPVNAPPSTSPQLRYPLYHYPRFHYYHTHNFTNVQIVPYHLTYTWLLRPIVAHFTINFFN